MYSKSIKLDVDLFFNDLKSESKNKFQRHGSSVEIINAIVQNINSRVSFRSKELLSNMLFDLNDQLFETEFFSDISRQNRVMEADIRQEILDKYKFNIEQDIDYQKTSALLQAAKIGGATFVVGGVCQVGVVLISGLSMSTLVPIPIGILFAVAFGVTIADYLILEPKKDEKILSQALDKYFSEAQQQFLSWFDEIEKYFYQRIEEIKKTL